MQHSKSQQINLGRNTNTSKQPLLGSAKIDSVKKEISHDDKSDGYMKYIRTIQKSGNQIIIKTVDGEFYHGIVRSFDSKTISLKVKQDDGGYANKVFFTNNIIYFELKMN